MRAGPEQAGPQRCHQVDDAPTTVALAEVRVRFEAAATNCCHAVLGLLAPEEALRSVVLLEAAARRWAVAA